MNLLPWAGFVVLLVTLSLHLLLPVHQRTVGKRAAHIWDHWIRLHLFVALVVASVAGFAGGYAGRPVIERVSQQVANGFAPGALVHQTVRPRAQFGASGTWDGSAPWRDGRLQVHNQYLRNSCVLEAMTSALEWWWLQKGGVSRTFSGAYVYHSVGADQTNRGTTYDEDLAALARSGTPRLSYYDFSDSPLPPPSPAAIADAAWHRAVDLTPVFESFPAPGGQAGVDALHAALVHYQEPIIIGQFVGTEWSWANGQAVLSGPTGVDLFGRRPNSGHVMLAVGYVPPDATRPVGGTLVLNSWSAAFGRGGIILVPDTVLAAEMFDAYRIVPGAIVTDHPPTATPQPRATRPPATATRPARPTPPPATATRPAPARTLTARVHANLHKEPRMGSPATWGLPLHAAVVYKGQRTAHWAAVCRAGALQCGWVLTRVVGL